MKVKYISALGWKHSRYSLPPAPASPLDNEVTAQWASGLKFWDVFVPLGSLRFVCLSEVLEAETDFQGSDTAFLEVYSKFVGAIFKTVLIIQRTSLTFDRRFDIDSSIQQRTILNPTTFMLSHIKSTYNHLRLDSSTVYYWSTVLPWWLSGKESTRQCRRHGFDPWSRKTPHAVQQLSSCTTTTEPVF